MGKIHKKCYNCGAGMEGEICSSCGWGLDSGSSRAGGKCYYCDKYDPDVSCAVKVPMYKVVGAEDNGSLLTMPTEYKVYYETKTVEIPRCEYCAKFHEGGGDATVLPAGCNLLLAGIWLIPAAISLGMEGTAFQKGLAFVVFMGLALVFFIFLPRERTSIMGKKQDIKERFGIEPKHQSEGHKGMVLYRAIRDLQDEGWTVDRPH